MNRFEIAAVAAFPELARLIELKNGGGWAFHPVVMDGEIVLLAGGAGMAGRWLVRRHRHPHPG